MVFLHTESWLYFLSFLLLLLLSFLSFFLSFFLFSFFFFLKKAVRIYMVTGKWTDVSTYGS